MKHFVESLAENQAQLKTLLPAQDILYYAFQTADETNCLLCYADGMVNKELLGELVAKPLSFLYLFEQRKSQNEPTVYKPSVELIRKTLRFPELKELSDFATAIKEILDGNTLLLIDGLQTGFIIGAKLLPVRAVTEPPTDVAVKGPREGFIEDMLFLIHG